MKKHAIIILVIVPVLTAVAWIPAARFIAWRHDYAEAERMVPLVWALADEMRRYTSEHGTPPASLVELTPFSKAHDFSSLTIYHPKLTPHGSVLFLLEVNSRFSFEIDSQFAPKWARVTGAFEHPSRRSEVYAPNQLTRVNARQARVTQFGIR